MFFSRIKDIFNCIEGLVLTMVTHDKFTYYVVKFATKNMCVRSKNLFCNRFSDLISWIEGLSRSVLTY